jgi:hypothetical protein
MNTKQVNQLNLNTMAAEQSVVELIFEQHNLLSDADFKSWMLNNYDELKDQHKLEVMGAYDIGQEDAYESGFSNKGALVFYKETYG